MNRHFFPTFAFFLKIFVSIDMYTAYLFSVIYISMTVTQISGQKQFSWGNLTAATYLIFDFLVLGYSVGVRVTLKMQGTIQSPFLLSDLKSIPFIHDSVSICLMHYTKMVWQFSGTNLKIVIRTFINCFSHRKFVFCLYHWRDRISEMNLTTLVLDETSSV